MQDRLEDAVIPPPVLPDHIGAAVFLIDKPATWSSFRVIKRMRPQLDIRKIGHAGTLDPIATGLLICCTNRMTKRIDELMGLPKRYTGTLRLGEITESFDAETPVVEERPWQHVTPADLENARRNFLGAIEQVPPMYSAVKVGGERLYKKARRGEHVERPPRRVTIHSFEVTDVRGPDVDFDVRCSKGTYIRTLIHDYGLMLGTGAHMTALRRTEIGPFNVADAWTTEVLESAAVERKRRLEHV